MSLYPSRPDSTLIAAFLDHVRETGSPETFPTICRTKPPVNSKPEFLSYFDIDRKKRPNGDEAPCPICSPTSPKFLYDGCLVWYPDEGVIRAIGPECGDSIFGGTMYADARDRFDRTERERRASEFLERNYPKLLQMLVALEAIRPATLEAARLYADFKRKAPAIQKEFRKINNRDSGTLKVTVVQERVANDNRVEGPRGFGKTDSEYDSHDEIIGQLPNCTLFLSRFDPVAERREIEDLLMAMPRFTSDYETFSWICDLSEQIETLEAAGDVLRRAAEMYARLVKRLDRVTMLFSNEVFQRLDAWGQHSANDFDLIALCDGTAFRLRHGGSVGGSEQVTFTPDLEKLRARMPWPVLD